MKLQWRIWLTVLCFMMIPWTSQATTVTLQTSLGRIEISLFDSTAPRTVANFLSYVNSGAYNLSFIHRKVPRFIIQGGGYTWNEASLFVTRITANPPVANEFSVDRSNIRGTIAMAKLGENPDSATTEWFINLTDNSENLNNQNGGFTVFGEVTDGMAVVDAIAALPIVNACGAFTTLPVVTQPTSGQIHQTNLVMIDSITINSDPVLSLSVEKRGTGGGRVTSRTAGINCGSDCSEGYATGTRVVLKATPNSVSFFSGWSGGNCSGIGTCAVTMNTNETITATFVRITHLLTVNKSGAGGGSVTSNPSGISCVAGCITSLKSYNSNTNVTLAAIPGSGSTFFGWLGGGCSGVGACMVTMSADQTVTAVFKANQTIGNITFVPATLTVGGTTAVSATATSRLAVTFRSTTPTICTVSGRTITGAQAGRCTISARQAGNTNYNPATSVSRNLTVTTP
ncbi:exported hypothetical protein [Gammaproteobacteria bacterium]